MRNPQGYAKEMEKKQKDFLKNQEKSRKFDEALREVVNQCSTSETKDYSEVEAKIKTIIPQKPDLAKLKQDLVNRRIIEQANGYFGRGWAWQISSVEDLKEVKITSEEKQGDDYGVNIFTSMIQKVIGLREKIFEKIFAAAEIAKLTPEEYEAYVDSLNSYRDLKNSIDTAKAEGEKLNAINTAKAMQKDNVPIDLIVKYTGLSIEDIKKL